MLIRRDVWDQLGGFDPNLPLFRDDIDFCWRAHAAGYERPGGHRRGGVPPRAVGPADPEGTAAAGGIRGCSTGAARCTCSPSTCRCRPMLGMVGSCLASITGARGLLPAHQAAAQGLGSPRRGGLAVAAPAAARWRARRRRAADRKHGYAAAARPAAAGAGRWPGSPNQPRVCCPAARPTRAAGCTTRWSDEPATICRCPVTDSVIRRVLTSPGVLLFAGLAVVALVAERSLTGSGAHRFGHARGGALVPAWGGAGDLWHEYLAGYHDAGVGSAASTPPYVAVMAALATLLGGQALAGGRRAAARLRARGRGDGVPGHPPPHRPCWPRGSGSRLPTRCSRWRWAPWRPGGSAPLGGLRPASAHRHRRRRILAGRSAPLPSRFTPRRAAWAAGLLIAVAAAFVPLLWLIAVVAALAAAAAWPWLGRATVDQRGDRRRGAGRAAPAVDVPPGRQPVRVLPRGRPAAARAGRRGPAAAGPLLLLSPGGPGLPPGVGHRRARAARVLRAAGPQARWPWCTPAGPSRWPGW